MEVGLHDSKVEIEEKVKKRKVVDLGPIMLDAERCVLCSRCLRYESVVTGTNSLQFVNRGNLMQIATFENRPIEHEYAGNLADVCPVGALLSRDFRFKMRVWFLKQSESVCPGCSTGCNIYVDQRDDEAQRLRPRRNVEVNKSWMCDPGRALYKQIAVTSRVSGARLKRAKGWEGVSVRCRPRRDCFLDPGLGQYRCVRGFAPGHQRGPVRVLRPGGKRGRAHRLPRRRSAAARARATRPGVATHRPQSQHTRRPGSRPGQGRRRPDREALRRGADQGTGAPGTRVTAQPGQPGRSLQGAVHRSDGDARGTGTRSRERRAARGDVGRGRGHVHQLPAPRPAHSQGRRSARRRAPGLGARRRLAPAHGRHARCDFGPRGLRAPRASGAGIRRPRLQADRLDWPGAAAPRGRRHPRPGSRRWALSGSSRSIATPIPGSTRSCSG